MLPTTNVRRTASVTRRWVKTRTSEGGAAVRDSKDRGAGYFTVSPEAWRRFVTALKADRLG